MVDESTIGPWLRCLRDADAQAMQAVWERFFESLVCYANRKLQDNPALKGTGEDVAASVFESLWRGCQAGRFQSVGSQSELWWTLLKMARQKCIDHTRRAMAIKRGGNETILPLEQTWEDPRGLYHALVSDTPDPQYLAIIAEETERCMSLLRDGNQRRIAALTMEGHSPTEIAGMVALSESSVRRKLKIVQNLWKRELRNGRDG
jgi:DNA-directed RNA polymerase specialized sigma24 family protein